MPILVGMLATHMKTKRVVRYFLVLSLLVGGYSGGQPRVTSDIDFAVEGLASSYRSPRDVSAQVVNGSARALYFACSPEAQFDEGWREIDYSIDQDPPGKHARVIKLAPGERVTVVWEPGPTDWYEAHGPGPYRLAIHVYELDLGEEIRTVYSRPFVLEPLKPSP
jgi:hypothetical protein